eukprot:6172205-Pleurochrysis_carterae.AAC.3
MLRMGDTPVSYMCLDSHMLACLSRFRCGFRRHAAQVRYNLGGGGLEIPQFTIDKVSAVDFLQAVLESTVRNNIYHSFCLSEAVAVQSAQLLLKDKGSNMKTLLAPHNGLQHA